MVKYNGKPVTALDRWPTLTSQSGPPGKRAAGRRPPPVHVGARAAGEPGPEARCAGRGPPAARPQSPATRPGNGGTRLNGDRIEVTLRPSACEAEFT